MRKILFALAFIASAATAATIGGSGVSGLRVHDHSGAGQGGNVISTGNTINGANLTLNSASSGTVRFSRDAVPKWDINKNSSDVFEITDTSTLLFSMQRTTGDISIAGAFASTKACASGYTRVTPNLCFKNANTANIGTVLTAGTCTSIAAPDGAAKALLLRVNSLVNSNNAIATRWSQIDSHSTSACNGTTGYFRFNNQVREFAAVAAGTTISDQAAQYVVPVPVWLILTRDTGNQGTGLYEVQGYYD